MMENHRIKIVCDYMGYTKEVWFGDVELGFFFRQIEFNIEPGNIELRAHLFASEIEVRKEKEEK